MENSQNTGVLRPISPEITLAEEKERKNREEQEERRLEKNAMIALLGCILETFLNEEKKTATRKGSRYIVCKNTFPERMQASLNQVDLIFWKNTHSVKTLHS